MPHQLTARHCQDHPKTKTDGQSHALSIRNTLINATIPTTPNTTLINPIPLKETHPYKLL